MGSAFGKNICMVMAIQFWTSIVDFFDDDDDDYSLETISFNINITKNRVSQVLVSLYTFELPDDVYVKVL